MKKNQNISLYSGLYLFGTTFLLSACSGIKTGDIIGDEDNPRISSSTGPGLLSGEKGGWGWGVGSKEKEATKVVENNTVASKTISSKPIEGQSLQQTSETLEDRIQRLERDKIELELLKREIDKKLAK